MIEWINNYFVEVGIGIIVVAIVGCIMFVIRFEDE